ncbi:hypothetical protein HPB48_012407 [Haemaphysalis longicornis]|uniref:Uncharacterized protein n=1 Tax=Haemaphysalis longicornis TaxID=44386 RepID=A0A9J6FZV8_HAELO|nr:hypothetical protein HPB48_012407 [Haemaphysalis longicornis]
MAPKSRKIAIMGFRSVGKSSLTIQFVENQFVDSYDPTIENTFHKIVKVKGQEYHLKLVDTAGQDYPSITGITKHAFSLISPLVGLYGVVSYEEGRQAAEYMKAAFMEASAKQNQSVFEIFSTMIQQIDRADGNVPEKQSCVVS